MVANKLISDMIVISMWKSVPLLNQSSMYIHKYIYKGHDRTTLELRDDQNRDEVKEYLDARYSDSKNCFNVF